MGERGFFLSIKWDFVCKQKKSGINSIFEGWEGEKQGRGYLPVHVCVFFFLFFLFLLRFWFRVDGEGRVGEGNEE